MTRRDFEKLCTKKIALIFWPLKIKIEGWEGVVCPTKALSYMRLSEGDPLNRRRSKGDAGKGTGKIKVTTLSDNFATRHDNFRHFCDMSVSLKRHQSVINVTTISDIFATIYDNLRQNFGRPLFGVPF